MQTSEQIIQVLNAFCEKFGIVIDWTTVNIQKAFEYLVPKLLKYEIVTSLYWMFIGIIFIIITYVSFSLYKRGIVGQNLETWTIKDEYDDDICIGRIIICCIAVSLTISSIIGSIMILSQTADIVKCIAFPELHAIKALKELMNGVN